MWNLSVNVIGLKVLLKIQPVLKIQKILLVLIDLILTNSHYSFKNSCVMETGLSDFHKMIVSVMKTSFQKLKPKIVQYGD